MDGNTITIRQVQDLKDLLDETSGEIDDMIAEIEAGEISPREAAAKINLMIEDLSNAAE